MNQEIVLVAEQKWLVAYSKISESLLCTRSCSDIRAMNKTAKPPTLLELISSVQDRQ